MAFKFCVFAAVLVIAQAGVLPYKAHYHDGPMDAIAETQEHVVRNSAGTVASQSKAIHTPYASVHKQDTRISHNNNNPYNKHTTNEAENDYSSYETPYNYHAHAHEQHTTTNAPTITYHHETPAFQQEASAYHHGAPIYHHETPTYHHEDPSYHQDPTTTATPVYYHGPAAHTYKQNDVISEHGSSQKVHYSPANKVSHMSFDGFGTHWGF